MTDEEILVQAAVFPEDFRAHYINLMRKVQKEMVWIEPILVDECIKDLEQK